MLMHCRSSSEYTYILGKSIDQRIWGRFCPGTRTRELHMDTLALGDRVGGDVRLSQFGLAGGREGDGVT